MVHFVHKLKVDKTSSTVTQAHKDNCKCNGNDNNNDNDNYNTNGSGIIEGGQNKFYCHTCTTGA